MWNRRLRDRLAKAEDDMFRLLQEKLGKTAEVGTLRIELAAMTDVATERINRIAKLESELAVKKNATCKKCGCKKK